MLKKLLNQIEKHDDALSINLRYVMPLLYISHLLQ